MPETETWTCAGQRWDTKSQRMYHAWYDGKSEDPLYYGRLKGILGGVYEISVTREGTNVRAGTPIYKRLSHDPRIPEWTMFENADLQLQTSYRREKNAKSSDALEKALTPLYEYARTCRTRAQKDALVATVIRRMTEVW